MNMIWIGLSIVQAVALVAVIFSLPGLYRREAEKEERA